MRDYLYHVYNVEVTAVRSFVNQARQQQMHGNYGKNYRPKSQKMMIAELAQPFVWPKPPAEDAREAFDYDMFKQQDKEQKKNSAWRALVSGGKLPMPSQAEVDKDRVALNEKKSKLVSGEEKWTHGTVNSFLNSTIVPEEEGWSEVEENISLKDAEESDSSNTKQ